MHLLWLTQTCIVLFTSLAHAAKLTVSIPSSSLIANPASLPPSTHAILIGSQGVAHDARLTRSNTLNFKDVTPGSYLLSVYTRDYQFPPFRVDVTLNEASTQELVQIWQTFRGNEWNNKGPKFGEGYGEVTISLQPSAKKEFYQQRGGCKSQLVLRHTSTWLFPILTIVTVDVLSFLKSPMILMAVVSLGLVFGMPYLMENSTLHCLPRRMSLPGLDC